MSAAVEDPRDQLKTEFGVDDAFVDQMEVYLTQYNAAAAPMSGGRRRNSRKRLQRGGGIREVLQKIVNGARAVRDSVTAALPATAIAAASATTDAASAAARIPSTVDSILASGIRHAGVIGTLTGLIAVTTAYGSANPYTKLVENALKFVLALTPTPWELVSRFFQSGLSLSTFWNLTDLGFRSLTLGALYYMLVLGSEAGGLASRTAISTVKYSGYSIGVQKARIVAYVETLVASLETRLRVPINGIIGVVAEADINAAGRIAAAAAAGAEAIAGAGAGAEAEAVPGAEAVALPEHAAQVLADALDAERDADADGDAAAEAAPDGLVAESQIHIAHVAAEAEILAGGGSDANVEHSQAQVNSEFDEAVDPDAAGGIAENAINALIPAVSQAASQAASQSGYSTNEVEMSQHGGRRRITRRKNRRNHLSRRRRRSHN